MIQNRPEPLTWAESLTGGCRADRRRSDIACWPVTSWCWLTTHT